MSRRRPTIPDKTTAVVLGIGFFLAGWYCLYDAWEGRGGDTPKLFRAFTWW